ncbi:MAG: LPS assembly protein LptD [Gammaproteobacteria bacterium]|nr:LPS assembly protein LptD [Gammaproteobacteria bacterium]
MRDRPVALGNTRFKRRLALGLLPLVAISMPPDAQAADALLNRWDFCPVETQVAERPLPTRIDFEPGTLELHADSADLVDGGVSEFNGGVVITRDDLALRADTVRYTDESSLLEIQGNVELWADQLLWRGEQGEYNIDTEFARLEAGEYYLLDRRGHGHARSLRNDAAADKTRMSRVNYTTCPGDDPSWMISARNVTLDHESDRGNATNVLIKSHGIPLLYFPYLSFPLNDERKSGFLVPSVGSSGDTGLDLQLPYYWNIAPNQDATFTPRLVLDRGYMMSGEYRYLGTTFHGQVEAEVLPSDSVLDRTRAFGAINHEGYFKNYRGYSKILLQGVSDSSYFEDFGRSLSATSVRFLERTVDVRYNATKFYFQSLIQGYQTVDRSILSSNRPYMRLPYIYVGLSPYRFKQLYLGMNFDGNYFHRSDSLTGGRLELRPFVQWNYRTAGAYLNPKLELRHTQYQLSNTTPGDPTSLSRTLPILSVDSGLFLERTTKFGGRNLLQTLEPRIYYLFVPHANQDDLPIFDTGIYDISFQSLFYNNRYAGGDRLGDANQVTMALTSRIVGVDSGIEHLRASLAQVFYFRDRTVTLPGYPAETDATSEVIGEVAGRLNEVWSARATVQWDPNETQFQKAAFSVRYQPGPGKVLNVGYRLRRAVTRVPEDIEQTDVSLRWPIGDRIHLLGRWNYSIPQSRLLESVAGVEIDSCCWSTKVVARRFLRNIEGDYDNAIFVQLELKGLAGIGRAATSFLRQSIPGYEPDF